jgi:Lrp/AsnC family transcriptional regulator, leucine-responsive regulatory protein
VFAAHLVTGRYDIDILVALHDFDELPDLFLNKFGKSPASVRWCRPSRWT